MTNGNCKLFLGLERNIHTAKIIYYKGEMVYRIYSNKRRGAYLIFRATSAALLRGQRLFKNCTRQIYSHAEAQKHDSNAVGVYLVTTQSEAKKTLAGHVPTELSPQEQVRK